jgi:hypothetical protein
MPSERLKCFESVEEQKDRRQSIEISPPLTLACQFVKISHVASARFFRRICSFFNIKQRVRGDLDMVPGIGNQRGLI